MVLKAVNALNPAIPSGQIQASAPPAKITSFTPSLSILKASPIECVPDAQAVTTVLHTPFAPICIETLPAAIFAIAIGTNNGETLLAPFS